MAVTNKPRWSLWVIAFAVVYFLAAYVIAPRLWKHHESKRPDLRDGPTLTHTASGIPGDPLNIALVGSEEDIIRAMAAAGWYPADPLTLRSSIRIGVDTVFKRPDDEAPVSSISISSGEKRTWLLRSQSAAVRKSGIMCAFGGRKKVDEGRPVWIGSAAYDIGVELSRTTGEITHHISPDVDAENATSLSPT